MPPTDGDERIHISNNHSPLTKKWNSYFYLFDKALAQTSTIFIFHKIMLFLFPKRFWIHIENPRN